MKTRKILILITAISLLKVSAAAADGTPIGIVLLPSISVQRESNQLYGDSNGFPFDFRAGYINASGMYFGALYTNQTITGQYSRSESSFGNSIGYFYSNAAVMLSYYIVSAQTESGPGLNFRRTGGSGFQADLAMTFPLAYGVSLAPMLTYKSLVFDKSESQGVITNASTVQTSLYPYFGIEYVF